MILSQQQREELANLAYEQAEIKYSQIRKKLNLPKEAKFVDLNYHIRKKKQEELLEQDIVKQVENTKFVRLEGWHKIRLALKANGSEEEFDKVRQNPQIQDIIADALVRNKTDETIRDYLQERKIEPQIIEAVLNINFTKFGHLSYKAMKKINPELEKGFTYDKACENIGYEFKGSKNDLQYKLPPVSNLENNACSS